MGSDIFTDVAAGDVLLHHPFQGFGPVADFIKQSASDPQWSPSSRLLYRAGSDSTIVGALIEAASRQGRHRHHRAGARFDEEANIELATQLQEAGAHVMYGVLWLQDTRKLVMVVRRRKRGCGATATWARETITQDRSAQHDYGLMTADESIGEDIHEIFSVDRTSRVLPRPTQAAGMPRSAHQALLAKIEPGKRHARPW